MKTRAISLAFAVASMFAVLSGSASATPLDSQATPFAMISDTAKQANREAQTLANGNWVCGDDWNPNDCYFLPMD